MLATGDQALVTGSYTSAMSMLTTVEFVPPAASTRPSGSLVRVTLVRAIDIAPAEVGGVDGDAVLGVDDSGDGDSGGHGGLAVPLVAEGAELCGEVEDRLHDGLGAALAPGGAAGLVEQGAVRPDEGGLHAGAAHIQGDDVSHG